MPLRTHGDAAVPPRFMLRRLLGEGGMGEVHEAWDRELDATVAIKFLHDDGVPWISSLKDEFRSLAGVRHRNLVRFGELFEHDRHWCFTMELVSGCDLLTWVGHSPRTGDGRRGALRAPSVTKPVAHARAMLRRAPTYDRTESVFEPRYDEQRLRDAFAQVCDGLDAIHARSIVHRDVKPSNVLVDPSGRVVLLDFGLATADRSGASNMAVGTIDYMAPEQAIGEAVTTAADLYAAGAMLYEMLVGRPPFEGSHLEIMWRKQDVDPIPPGALYPECPRDLDRLCMELLARDPAQRPTAAAVVQRLRRGPAAFSRHGGIAPGHRRTDVGILGRDRELAVLVASARAAVPGHPVATLVLGPVGIGKSALLDGFAQAVASEAALVCAGRCYTREHMRLNAWDVLIDGLTRHLSALPRDEREALLPVGMDAVARLFPSFARIVDAPAATSASPADLSARALEALGALLSRIADDGPVVVVIDDVHLATIDNLDLLVAFVSTVHPALCLVVSALARPDSADWLANSGERLTSLGLDVRRVFLGPLTPRDAEALARRFTGDGQRAKHVAEAAGGRPFHIQQLALSAPDQPIHDDLEGTLRQRIRGLAPQAQAVLEVLATAGTPLRNDLLAAVIAVEHSVLVQHLTELHDLRLARTTGVRRSDVSELWQGEQLTTMLALTSSAAIAGWQARLALALEVDGTADRAELCLRWASAGDGPRALRHATALVDSARDAFAFARAARACEQVLELEIGETDRAMLLTRLGDALVGEGQVTRGADAYRRGAELQAGDARLDLERRAAECYLRAGRVAEGMDLAHRVAIALGMPLDSSERVVLGRVMGERVRLRLRGLELGDEPEACNEADACYSLAIGLAMIDFVRATWFQARACRRSLETGDPRRGARALALEAAFVAAAGTRAAPRAHAALRRAEALLATTSDPAVAGLLATSRVVVAQVTGEFASAVVAADDAQRFLREQHAGVSWEEHTSEVFALWSLAWLGRWRDLEVRRAKLASRAEATESSYGLTFACLGYALLGKLAEDAPAEARRLGERGARSWPGEGFQTPQFHALVGDVAIDLYEGRGAEARRRLASAWPALMGSQLLRVQQLSAIIWDLRGRAALCASSGDDGLSDARRAARRLASVPWATGPALLLEAAIAARGARQEDLSATLEQAVERCAASGLQLHAAAARWRHGAVIAGSTGDDAQRGAVAEAVALGIVRPEVVFRMLVPWPRES